MLILILFKLLCTIIAVVFALGQWRQEGPGTGVISLIYSGFVVWAVWTPDLVNIFSPEGELGLF